MSMHAAQPLTGQCLDPHADDFVGIEYDHLWWINDAARIVRTDDWSSFDPQHLRHMIEEVRDLQCILDNERRGFSTETPF